MPCQRDDCVRCEDLNGGLLCDRSRIMSLKEEDRLDLSLRLVSLRARVVWFSFQKPIPFEGGGLFFCCIFSDWVLGVVFEDITGHSCVLLTSHDLCYTLTP